MKFREEIENEVCERVEDFDLVIKGYDFYFTDWDFPLNKKNLKITIDDIKRIIKEANETVEYLNKVYKGELK